MGQFPLIPPDHYKFCINLAGHVADLVGFLTRDPSPIWNTVVILPPMQHHSFFRNLPPKFVCTCRLRILSNTRDSVSSGIQTL